MFIKQVSVFLENAKGTLCELTEMLSDGSVNLLAISIADTTGFGIIRLIVPSGQVDKAVALIKEHGLIAKKNDVIAVRVPHTPGGLSTVLRLLEGEGLSVEYAYSFCKTNIDDAVIILRTSDKHIAEALFEREGICMLSQSEVDLF